MLKIYKIEEEENKKTASHKSKTTPYSYQYLVTRIRRPISHISPTKPDPIRLKQLPINGLIRKPNEEPKLGSFILSVPVVNRLVRTFNGYADIVRLVLGKLGESCTKLA